MTPSMTALANALIQARQSNQTLDATSWLNTLETADQAYEVQDAVASALAWFGGQTVPRYWKSGGASRSATLTHAPLPRPACARARRISATWPFTCPASRPRSRCASGRT